MFFRSLFRHLKWDSARYLEDRPRLRPKPARARRPARRVPWLEVLEDRTVPSTFTVTSAADDGAADTLRAVLAAAHSGDTIQFAKQLKGQTITLTHGQLMVSQSVNINGLGADKLAISGNAASRIFDVGAGATVTISGLTLKAGLATDGAGILNGGNLTLSQDTLSANVAQGVASGGLFGDGGGRGGGVENQTGATLSIVHSLFVGNQALGGPNGGNALGGGIYNEAGALTVDHSAFTANEAIAGNGGSVGIAATLPGGISATLLGVGAGGGVWNDGGSIAVTNSTLSNNQDQGGNNGDASSSTAMLAIAGDGIGGAIGSGSLFTTATPSVSIAGSTLSGNQSVGGSNLVQAFAFASEVGNGRGGALGVIAGDVTLANSAVNSNIAGSGDFTVVRGGSLIAAFGAAGIGGGIDDAFDLGFSPPAASPALSITGSRISGNVAQGNRLSGEGLAGGLDTSFVNAQVTNSTVSGNQAIGGPGGSFYNFYGYFFFNGGGFAIDGGMSSNGGALTISGSTVKDNLAQGGSGGATVASGRAGGAGGGGIGSNNQIFVLSNSTISGNQAVGGKSTYGGYGGSGGSGGLSLDRDSATISGTAFVNNLAEGTAGGPSGGGFADGGGGTAAYTTLKMTDCTFAGNEALGGPGGMGANGGAGGAGGEAFAGGFHIDSGVTATVTNTSFIRNLAQGGSGGAGDTGGIGGAGGAAFGGGLASVLATTTVNNCSFIQDVAQGGAGGVGGVGANGGSGGFAEGGALWNVLAFAFAIPEATSLAVSNSSIVLSEAVGGDGGAAGVGGIGGNGGAGVGGAFYNSTLGIRGQAKLTISSCLIAANEAEGGAGGSGGGNGGKGLGGGLFIDTGTTATVLQSVIVANEAEGGAAGTGGSAGQGIGGGVYNRGTFDLDAFTLIAGNDASTSNDDVFGPITPI